MAKQKVIKCPCCGKTITADDIYNGLVWDVDFVDVEHYKKFGEFKGKLYTVCDECFCDFGNEIVPYDDEDVFEMEEYAWLKDNVEFDYFKRFEAESSYFMTEIPQK